MTFLRPSRDECHSLRIAQLRFLSKFRLTESGFSARELREDSSVRLPPTARPIFVRQNLLVLAQFPGSPEVLWIQCCSSTSR
jgi:hypothetical protein